MELLEILLYLLGAILKFCSRIDELVKLIVNYVSKLTKNLFKSVKVKGGDKNGSFVVRKRK